MREERHLHGKRQRRIRREGTTLILGSGRHVRVLTLPGFCGQRLLPRQWEACFGAEEVDGVEVWWPYEPPAPSRN
jgi:hypothetical protein